LQIGSQPRQCACFPGSPFTVYKDVNEFFKGWKGRYDYLSLREPTERVLDMLDEYEVTATFFVVADVVEHYPGLVESIVERGYEIGCHGLHHACKIDPKTKEPLMSVKKFEDRTLEAKETLEKWRVITFIYCKIYFLRGEDR